MPININELITKARISADRQVRRSETIENLIAALEQQQVVIKAAQRLIDTIDHTAIRGNSLQALLEALTELEEC